MSTIEDPTTFSISICISNTYVVPCTFKYVVPVFWQLYFSGVEVMVCGFVVDKKE